MEIGAFRKLDQKNRFHIPQDLLDALNIPPNSEVYVSNVLGEPFLRIYPKKYLQEQYNAKRNKDF